MMYGAMDLTFYFFTFDTQGIVRLGAVDADAHKSLGAKYGVQGFPTIKVFGTNKNSPSDYRGK
jgi:protein disulfide-isomerase A6